MTQWFRRVAAATVLVFVAATPALAQRGSTNNLGRLVPSLPAACVVGDVVFHAGSPVGLHECRTANTWSQPGGVASADIDTSAELAAILTDEVGTDKVVFNTAPTFVTSLLTSSSTFALFNTTATTVNAFGAATTVNLGASASGAVYNLGGAANAAEFRFLEPSGSGTNYSAFKAVAQAANLTYQLPNAFGSAGATLTDAAGDGILSWAVPAGSGDVTAVGDCASGACFNGTAGTTLTFEDAGGDATLIYSAANDNFTFLAGKPVLLGAAGVSLAGDGDGAITFLGLGNGSDEDLTFNLDDVANTIGVSSSTGVTTIDFGTITLTIPADVFDSSWNGVQEAAPKDAVYDMWVALATIPVPDTTSIVEGSGDGTKEVRIEADGITTGTIRVWTAPDANTTIPIISQILTFSGPTAARTYTLPDANSTLATLAGSETFTNKTLTSPVLTTPALGTPASGTLNLPFKILFHGGGCDNATAYNGGNLPSTLGATAVCETTAAASGDPTYGTVSFLGDGSQSEWHQSFRLPSDWTATGGLDAIINWRAISTTANDVVWLVQTGCVGAGEASTAITYNTANAFTADTNLTTTLQHNLTASTALTTTGCAAGETFYFKVLRDTDTAGDTLDQPVQMVWIEFTYRRAVVIGG